MSRFRAGVLVLPILAIMLTITITKLWEVGWASEVDGPIMPLLNTDVEQDNPELISHIKKLLQPPSSSAYNFSRVVSVEKSHKLLLGQYGELGRVVDLFKGKKDGFFLECGAMDGEDISNSLIFELQLGWKGLLIEGSPTQYARLKTKHRKAHSLQACLSTKSTPMNVQFEMMVAPGIGGIIEDDGKSQRQKSGNFKEAPVKEVVSAQCFPLYSVLMAMGNPTVDYLSLDVEGAEQGIIESVPWDKVDIRVLQVEFTHVDEKRLKKHMEEAGYENPFNQKEDMIFVKKGFPPSA